MSMRAHSLWLVVVLGSALMLTSCSEENPCETEGPPRLSYDCVYQSSFRTCAIQVDEFGIEGFARSLGVPGGDADAVASAFAEPFSTLPNAAHDGCLAALQES